MQFKYWPTGYGFLLILLNLTSAIPTILGENVQCEINYFIAEDQCADDHGCSQTCASIAGVDTCSCFSGFMLSGSTNCVSKDYTIFIMAL